MGEWRRTVRAVADLSEVFGEGMPGLEGCEPMSAVPGFDVGSLAEERFHEPGSDRLRGSSLLVEGANAEADLHVFVRWNLVIFDDVFEDVDIMLEVRLVLVQRGEGIGAGLWLL